MKRMTENIMRMKIRNIIQLQLVVIIYTISSVMSKIAAGYRQDIVKFILFFALEFLILGLYAILWQQLIKKFDLSVAYANRSMALLWSMLWAFFFLSRYYHGKEYYWGNICSDRNIYYQFG